MKETVLYYDFFKEYYEALKILPHKSIGKIMLALMSELFDDAETEVSDMTAEENAILLLLEDLVELHKNFSNMFE